MAGEPVPWSLTIPSDLRLLALARAFVEGVCQAASLDPSLTNAVVLATDEATNNIMRHAHQGSPATPLLIQCTIRPDAVEILLHDEGDPFDISGVPHLDPAELRVGGRGVFLMRAIMDELSCQPRDGRGNVLRMVKRRSSATRASAPV